jgi:hypothetical protein
MLAVLFVAGLLTLHPVYAEFCRETGQPGQKDCASYHVALVAAWQIAEFVRSYHGLVTALATLAIAAFAWALWRATDKLWRAGDERLEFAREAGERRAREVELSLAAARDAAKAARRSAERADETVKTMERNARRELRAYVSPSNGRMVDFDPDQLGKPFAVRVVFKNSGKTPAHDLRNNGGIAFSTFPLREPLVQEEQFLGAGTLGPGLEYNLNIGARGITPEQWNALLARTHALYVHGSYAYRDVFDQPRTGTFCFYYGGAQGMRADRMLTLYPEGNASD